MRPPYLLPPSREAFEKLARDLLEKRGFDVADRTPLLTRFFMKLAQEYEPEWESPVQERSYVPAVATGALAGLAAQRHGEIERARKLYGKVAPQHVPTMFQNLKWKHRLGPAAGGLLFGGADYLARQAVDA